MSAVTSLIPGRATPEGTRNFPRTLGRSGLKCSLLGFGCYRINQENPNHRAALEQALLSGVNLIDTSTNYGDGESEIVVGEVLERLLQEERLQREQVVVVSKIGYCQGQALEVVQPLQDQCLEPVVPALDRSEELPILWSTRGLDETDRGDLGQGGPEFV